MSDNIQIPENHNLGDKIAPSLNSYEHLRITDKTEVAPPIYSVILYGAPIGISGEITGLSGEEKSGKTAIESMTIACCISDSGKAIDSVDGLEAEPNIYRKAVIHVDTEQPAHKHKRNVETILLRAQLDTCPDFYLSYNLRREPLNEYFDTLSGICKAAFIQFSGIHSIFVDGGADFISDVNDPEQSNMAIKYFDTLALQYNCAVFTIIHTNPGGTKERGHLGSQLRRKCGALLSVIADEKFSYIIPKFLRYGGNADIPSLKFKWDGSKGYHVGDGIIDEAKKDDDKFKKEIDRIWIVCQKVFDGQNSFEYAVATEQIMKHSHCGIAKAKQNFTQMKVQGMIIQGDDKRWRLNSNYIS